jgi:sugar diacid utilization regulator
MLRELAGVVDGADRLRRIQERTGRNPRRIADLLDLLVAVELDGNASAG